MMATAARTMPARGRGASAVPRRDWNLPPPANQEAEQALLGGLMLDNGAIDRLPHDFSGDCFFVPLHGRIYAAIRALIDRGVNANIVSLKPAFAADPDIVAAGGIGYLADLSMHEAALIGIGDFGAQLMALWHQRRLIEALTLGVDELVASDGDDVATIVAGIERRLHDLPAERSAMRPRSIRDCFDAAYQLAIDEREGRRLPGLQSAFLPDVHRLTGGIRPGNLVILGGRPGMGKTGVALSWALGCAANGHEGEFVSLEMSADELGARAISDLIFDYGVSPSFQAVRTGRLAPIDERRVMDARDRIASWPLNIVDPSTLTVGELFSYVRRARRERERKGRRLDFVVVDYLQLLRPDRERRSRYEEVSDISIALKQIAKDNDVAMVVLAQLSREVERREDKRPVMSDLRDSGQLEQDADTIIFAYRDEYYLARAEPPADTAGRARWETLMDAARDKVELIAGKVRNAATGKVLCNYFADHQAVRGSDYFKDREYGA